jgi:anaerobic magnesium-protoporphyrin IX monomethyl ester cyclase
MKILFVVHELDFADHIAIAYLSGIAKQLGHSRFFCCLEHDNFIDTVKEVSPDVIAYSILLTGFKASVEANNQAKKIHKFTSIMGGPHPTFSPETFSESGMDAFCVGEGEYAFKDFLVQLEKNESYDDVANLITKLKSNPVRPLIRNLDELPLADRDLVISNSFLQNTQKKTFYATRGCPFKCSYCCNDYYQNMYRGKGPIVRRFSVERVIQEIEYVKSKYRMDFIKFGDDCFVTKANDWLEEFSEKYSQRIGIPFNCYVRLDRLSDNLLILLKKAGCFSVHLGMDSTNERIRNGVLNRRMKFDNEEIAENLRKIGKHGINTWVNFMLAVPGSTLQDDLDTIELGRKGKVTFLSYSTTVPMLGTELYNKCVEENIIDPESYIGDLSTVFGESLLDCFSKKEKEIRYNIQLLGALISKFPYPLRKLAVLLIKVVPPNSLFKKIKQLYLDYNLANKIFILPREKK